MLKELQSKGNSPEKSHIAYFSMEIGISHTLPTYSGGLGILAGDLLKSYADMSLPVVAMTLLNEKGYFYQRIDSEGNQIDDPVHWNAHEFMQLLPNRVIVHIEGREVKLKVWKHVIRGQTGFNISVYFLDSNCEDNSDYDKTLTSHLYGGDRYYRLCQEVILGIGGVRMLESLGYSNIKKYHLNEGHASLLTIELLKKTYHDNGSEESSYDVDDIKKKCVFTTHTPVAAGHDHFKQDIFKKVLGDFVPSFIYNKILADNEVNMTLLGLTMSKYVNGVAKRHQEVTKEMFPEYQIDSITNGVHLPSWVCPSFKELFDKNIPGWSIDPFTLRSALSLHREEVWDAHYKSKNILIDYINQLTNMGFHIDRFTIGYARRFTAYKRPSLILHDIERLKEIAEKVGDIQIVFAGKAHVQDKQGTELIKKVNEVANEINNQNCKIKIVFLPNYDMKLGKMMVSGCDIWLNNPQRPYEASGTSGMKAALNGVPQISTIDGWWVEGHIENLTGWSLGPNKNEPGYEEDYDETQEAEDLYKKLESIIVPLYYNDRMKWAEIMRHCIAINASFFNTFRMAEQYIANAYLD
jgi:glycogen phosphorylase